jgi:hypothetical protein
MTKRIALSLVLLGTLLRVANAQAPASLPGYSVSTFVGYSSLQNANNNNGLFTSLAVPLKTWDSTWSRTLSARADNFLLTTPGVNVVLFGPEVRFQFSKATLFNGEVFQPFGNGMAGAARNNCVATTTCASGVATTTKAAYKVGGGLDMVLSPNMTLRLFEYDYINSTIFPGGHVTVHNLSQFTTGIGFHF